MTDMRKFNNVNEIKAAVSESGSHFFDEDTMEFFKSKVEPGVYGLEGRVFITSEQGPDIPGHRVGRRWTIREVWTLSSGLIGVDSVGSFMQFGTLSGARKAAKSYAEAGEA